MATKIQEIGFQLMKSPRELASWNFPLSKVLDEYSALLPEAGEIHYGEVALVIQNSVNAYVRRLEELYDETRCFNIKLIHSEGKTEGTSFFKEEIDTKSVIDFASFKLLDFTETGKKVNLQIQNRKAVNFLYNCFSQLENLNCRLYINLQDIQNELIGKKYDFRCNQRISKCGGLVDEFNSDDFCDNCTLINNSIAIKSKNYSKLDNPLMNLTSSAAANNGQTFNKYVSFSSGSTASNSYAPIEEHKIIESAFVPNLTHRSSTTNVAILKFSSSICSNANNFETTSSQIGGENSDNMNFETLTNYIGQEDTDAHLKYSDFCFDVNNPPKQNFEQNNSDNNHKKTLVHNPNSLNFKQSIILRRSDRIMYKDNNNSIFAKNETIQLKPISFTSGIPDKVEKNRTKFRFPCNRRLLTGSLIFRSKKHLKTKKKNTEFTNVGDDLGTIEYDDTVAKFGNISNTTSFLEAYSESSDQFHGKNLCFKKKRSVKYNPITTIKMDLLGFEPDNDKYVKFLNQSSYAPYMDSVISSPEYPFDSENDSTSTLLLPNLSRSLKSNTSIQTNITKQYRSGMEVIIKEKIKKIYKELDLLTDQDEKIAKWHEEIKPKLIEAELKPPFFIHEYESRIVQKLQKSNRRLDFNEIIYEESFSEIARFFSATLQLASTNNLDINPSRNFHKGLELVLLD